MNKFEKLPAPKENGDEAGSEKKSRRQFLKSAGVALGSASFGLVSADALGRSSQESAEVGREGQENVVTLETDNAFYNIVYSIHTVPNQPATLRGADAAVFELVSRYDPEIIKYGVLLADNYRYVLSDAIRHQKPVYCTDLSIGSTEGIQESEIDREVLKSELLLKVETMIGFSLVPTTIQSLAKEVSPKEPGRNRRSFLTTLAKAGATFYFLAPIGERKSSVNTTSTFTQEPNEASLDRKVERLLRGINTKIHPELVEKLVLRVRNDLIAQKTETAARQLSKTLGRKPTVSLYVGAAHTGIERSLQDIEEKRLQRLKENLGNNFASQGRIIRLDFMQLENGEDTVAATVLHDPAFGEEREGI